MFLIEAGWRAERDSWSKSVFNSKDNTVFQWEIKNIKIICREFNFWNNLKSIL